MISNIVKGVFYVLYTISIMIVFVAGIIAAAVWLATSGELLIIALIVAFVIGFAVMLTLAIITVKEIFTMCQEVDNKLKEIKENE